MEELSSVAEVIWIVIRKKDGRGVLARGVCLGYIVFGSDVCTSFCYLFFSLSIFLLNSLVFRRWSIIT